jgi:TonB family C-terminal domain
MTIFDSPQRRKGSSLGRWAALALLIHLQLLLVAGVALHIWAPHEADILAAHKRAAAEGSAEPIAVSTVDDATARKLIADMERLEEKAKEEQAKKESESAKAPGQVVDLARPREEKRPENARFAAEYDSSVEHETRKYGRFDPNEQQRSRGDSDRNRAAVAESAGSPKPPGSAGALAMRIPSHRRPMSAPGEPDKAPGEAGEQPSGPSDPEGLFAPPGGGGSRRAPSREREGEPLLSPGPGVASLLPTEEEVARAVGSGTQDHLKDVDDGEETALNAKRWKFATFFNRVKEQVRDRWKPVEEYQRRDPTGAIYGAQDRLTQLHVQLRPDGSLAKVSLAQTCGVDFLDDTAIEAFKQAQPFPNPPHQLVQASGLIDFDFGFYLEISGSPRVRFLKYKM